MQHSLTPLTICLLAHLEDDTATEATPARAVVSATPACSPVKITGAIRSQPRGNIPAPKLCAVKGAEDGLLPLSACSRREFKSRSPALFALRATERRRSV